MTTSQEHLSINGKSHDDEDIVVSKEVQDEDLRTRIKTIITQIKTNRNRPSYQNIYDHLKRNQQYQGLNIDSDLIPFIDTMVSDGHIRNTGRDKESFSVVSGSLSESLEALDLAIELIEAVWGGSVVDVPKAPRSVLWLFLRDSSDPNNGHRNIY